MKSSVTIFKSLRRIVTLLILLSVTVNAGTTGKISGKVTDEDGEPVVGANIIIEGTYLGAAADIDGYFYINNIPPGEYRLLASAVGYQKTIIENVAVKIDLTTKLDITLYSTSVQLKQEVVVKAERPLVQKDLTSTSATISSGEIQMMPVENVHQIINLQAGVVDGHFRGGRSNEVAYLIDGVSVTDAFNNSLSVQVENSSIRQMEVISGTFNAEYGQAMSGVVNIVTNEGSQRFEGNVTGHVGNYVTGNTDLFRNLDKVDRIGSQSLQFSLSGPTKVLDRLTFFMTGRYFEDNGHLYGQRVYNVNDDIPIQPDPQDPTVLIHQNTGDGSYVAMDPSRIFSFNGKLTYTTPLFKFSYSLFWDDHYNKYYDHYSSWTPDAKMKHYRTNQIHGFQISHYPSQSTFQTLKFSANFHNYKGYLYEDPFDPKYVDPQQGNPTSDYTFRQGGNEGGRYKRDSRLFLAQWSLSSQISKEHKIGIGVEGRMHRIYNHNMDLINTAPEDAVDSLTGRSIFTPGYPYLGTITDLGQNVMYTRKPYEVAAYIQDKMEYDIMIINAGVRFDYFNPNTTIRADLRNVFDDPNFPGAGQYRKVEAKYQVSPRLGASFPITDQGIIRFSYGHFFQIPNFENLFQNPDYIISRTSGALSSTTGNPDLKPQKTIMYEIGLQQVLFPNLSLDFTVYYRDIRNLLGMEIINTYGGAVKYARFINRDYGNVRGFILTLDKRFADYFSAKIDYTYQIAEGNASDPMQVFNNNQTDPPLEETKMVVPLNWDQRHTLNFTTSVGVPGDWIAAFIFQYGSGLPYTEDVRISNGVRFENGGIRPASFNLDFRAEKVIDLGGFKINTYLWVYNILDIKNEYGVYSTTGRATTDLGPVFTPVEVIGLNTVDQFIKNPSMYSSPREIRLGFGFGF